MQLFSLSFLIGVCSILVFTKIISIPLLIALLIIAILFSQLYKCDWTKIILFITLGFCWVMLISHIHLQQQLPKSLEGKTINVVGYIDSLPKNGQHSTGFDFQTVKFNQDKLKRHLKLNWYQAPLDLKVGDTWQLTVRLKRPHGFMNPGGFDYEAQLFQENITATGYVVGQANNQFMHHAKFTHFMDRFRQYLKNQLERAFQADRLFGFLLALLIGFRENISPDAWHILQQTGTNHLIAIAGLHIGFIAGFVYILLKWIWSRMPKLPLYLPAQSLGAIFSLLAAIFYALLAGFNLPTQRALVMLSVFLFSVIAKRKVATFQNVSLALFIVLLINPLSVMTAGFWMSFASVSIIIFGMRGRLRADNLWWKWGRIQWVIAVGLIPICLWFFDNASLISPIANIIAVSWFGLLIMPLCFFGLITFLLFKPIGGFILGLALANLHALWWVLTQLSHLPLSTWHFHLPNMVYLLLLSIAVLLMIAPRGFPARYLSIFLLFPFVMFKAPHPESGKIWLTVLDVGQGLSSVIQTAHHTLVFDAGPKFSENFNAGDAVLVPYLSVEHIHPVDVLMISHGDNDHIGGADAILQSMRVNKILTSVPSRFLPRKANFCHQGQHWQFDGVDFDVLWPASNAIYEGNNSSCVLKVTSREGSVLLTGDIEKVIEKQLVNQYGNRLKADILVAPHHGSRTSSSNAFIRAVKPKYVLFPIGYRNRFRFPSRVVLRRYYALGTKDYDTASGGAIIFQDFSMPVLYRRINRHIWNDQMSS